MQETSPGSLPVYRDPARSTAARVADLIERMSLEEKVAQLRSIWISKYKVVLPDGTFDPARAHVLIPDGIGFVGRPVDAMGMAGFPANWHRSREETIAFVDAVQRYLVEETRLGIPALFHDETAHGFVARGATIFPIPPALASTWDEDLVEEVFTVVAREARSVGSTVSLGPVLDLARDPRYGRVEEFFGEDPYLVGRMGVAAVRGLQGRSRPLAADRMFATLKHFLHASPEGGINAAPAPAHERSLRETYLAPFVDVVREANPAFIMPSYNEVGGLPSHASRDLLQRLGRALLGFEGVYLSDYDALARLISDHRVAAGLGEAAAIGLTAGVDVDLPDGEAFSMLAPLVREGLVDETLVDEALARVLALKFEAGLFEQPYGRLEQAEYNSAEAVRLARNSATRALTLLTNDGILPLDPNAEIRLAVVGPNAGELYYGGYSGENDAGVSVLDGLRAAIVGSAITVEHAEGVRLVGAEEEAAMPGPGRAPVLPVDDAENRRRIKDAVAVVERADVVLLVVGDHPAIARETTRPLFPGDRNELGLYGLQEELVEAVVQVGKPVIALLVNGRPIAATRLAAGANALLEGWYLGQETGNAVADVLFGRAEPGGRLPVSVPRASGAVPVYYDRHTSANLYPYVEVDRTPLFPFGHGLGYTTFDISEPVLDRSSIHVGESVGISVEVSNTGNRAGDEVVQLYVRDDVSSVPRPELQLRGFRRITLEPGRSTTVRFVLEPHQLAFWNIDLTERIVEPGTFTISVGRSSTQLRSVTLSVAGPGSERARRRRGRPGGMCRYFLGGRAVRVIRPMSWQREEARCQLSLLKRSCSPGVRLVSLSAPTRLRVEHLDEAFGTEVRRPRLSWWLPAGSARQTAHRISTGEWDSGRIESDRARWWCGGSRCGRISARAVGPRPVPGRWGSGRTSGWRGGSNRSSTRHPCRGTAPPICSGTGSTSTGRWPAPGCTRRRTGSTSSSSTACPERRRQQPVMMCRTRWRIRTTSSRPCRRSRRSAGGSSPGRLTSVTCPRCGGPSRRASAGWARSTSC
ncbi:glycoside hydrolase family 3 domain protein [Parafrankia sp. EAN1pec]|uniref:glycoside hydrolase family 3 N-terminal domain-containing protein n=1 Tax=Parafrankia sp. (strain EAN1pec) TaxID=298653 RepID=UPI0000542CCC|nr:glycoside hydrolase family 3 domain protein [Frankia sp. EAN1pec]